MTWEVGGMKDILVIALAPIGGKREKEAFNVLKRNAGSVAEVAKKLENLIIAFFSERDIEKAEKLGRELSVLETKADKGRRDFMRILHEGAFMPAFRGDLARLAEQLDGIADTAEGAMRSILLREKLRHAIRKAEKRNTKLKELRARFIKMAKLTTETIGLLKRSVELLSTDIDASLKKSQEVDELEHEVDTIEQGLLSDLYEHEKYFDPVTVLQLVDLIHRLGNISDRAEDTSDLIEIIAYTFRA